MAEETNRPFKCEICDAEFETEKKLKMHLACVDHDNNDNVKCDICGTEFSQKKNMEIHKRVHHKIEPKSSDIGDSNETIPPEIPYNNDNNSHDNQVHEEKKLFRCAYCESNFDTLEELSSHHKQLHKDKRLRLKCSICTQSFLAKRSLTRHIKTVHEGIKPFKCELCNVGYYTNIRLRCHYQRVHKEKKRKLKTSFKCEYCNTEFSSKTSLITHNKKFHDGKKLHYKPLPKKPFKCPICNKGYKVEYYLTLHIQGVHEGKKPFLCELCNNAFGTIKALNNHHKQAHEGKNPLNCKVCGKLFLKKFVLNRHMKIHRNEKPVSCNQCNMTFRQKGDLKKHRMADKCSLNENLGNASSEQFLKMAEKETNCQETESPKIHKRVNEPTTSGMGDSNEETLEYEIQNCDVDHVNDDIPLNNQVHEGKKPFKCAHCKSDFDTFEEFTVHHEELHQGKEQGFIRDLSKKQFKCRSCPKEYSEQLNLIWHVQLVHKGKKPFKCENCNIDFEKVKEISRHNKEFHQGENLQLKCNICQKVMTNAYGQRHMVEVHGGEKPSKCSRNKKVNKRSEQSSKMTKKETNCQNIPTLKLPENPDSYRKFKCMKCSDFFNTRALWQSHNAVMHENNISKSTKNSKINYYVCCVCCVCGDTFNDKNSLTQHMAETHKYILLCDLCEKVFHEADQLKRHIATTHHGKEPKMLGNSK